MVTPSKPLPPMNNFCLYPPPVLRCFWKDPLMTPPPHHPTSSILHCYPPKLQVNYGKAIRSNFAPDVNTGKDHKDAVDKMKKAVIASLYHSIMLKDNKVRHQFCPSGDTSWCKFRRLGNMENAPRHLEPAFLDIPEPLYTNRFASFELLSRCLPKVTQNVLESINSILWQKVPKHKFHGTKIVHIGACSTVIYYNQGATGKFIVLTLMSLPLFHNALEVARGKDQQRL